MSNGFQHARHSLSGFKRQNRWHAGRWGAVNISLFCLAIGLSAQPIQITEYPLASGLSGPAGITAGPDGALWLSSRAGISRVTTAGVVTDTWPIGSAIAGIAWAGVPTPGAIIAGPDGALWFPVLVFQNLRQWKIRGHREDDDGRFRCSLRWWPRGKLDVRPRRCHLVCGCQHL